MIVIVKFLEEISASTAFRLVTCVPLLRELARKVAGEIAFDFGPVDRLELAPYGGPDTGLSDTQEESSDAGKSTVGAEF